MLLEQYLPVAIFALVAISFPIGTYILNWMFSPYKQTVLRDTTYECGEAPMGEAQIQFHFQYYMFAIIFVVFDVAAIFLILWGLSFDALSGAASIIVVLFVGILTVATLYSLKKEETVWI
jgi:NADH:ubiquinone oxidoreductase subunit 3 (subunit A)